MPEESKHGVECSEFEALLSDALEGQLSGARKESFEAHRRVCSICGPLFADVQAGQQWLRALDPVEPPVHLVHNILAATSGVVSTRPATATGTTTPFGERLRERWDSFFAPLAAFVRQPRFVMSFGMIFFSLSLGLNVAGVKPADVAKVNLRPSALRHAYNDAQIKVVKYYDNIRFVYEIESKVRELKRANTPAEPAPEQPKENRKNDSSGQPDNRQDRNYSRDNSQIVLAAMTGGPNTGGSNEARSCQLRAASSGQTEARSRLEARSSKPPVVTVTTNRRFV
ncbi:MAG: zf-HC2 domain-containing protein [Terriglobales bacterium]